MNNSSTIKFFISRKVTPPSRAFNYDAGIDFFVPEFNSSFITDLLKKNDFLRKKSFIHTSALCISDNRVASENSSDPSFIKFDENNNCLYIELLPNERILIPSGVYCEMESGGRALIAANKSGISAKHGLIFGSQVVDYQYQGEIHLSLINVSNYPVKIYEGMKIIQFIETPIYNSSILFFDSLNELYSGSHSERGEGSFGSSDKNNA